jgi:ATP-binding cassette subfamily B (MDR/TAP) protein 1
MSEKVALSVSFVSAFLTGFIMAYIRSWKLALALTTIIPCIGITGGVMNKLVSKYMQSVHFAIALYDNRHREYHRASFKHVAEGGTLAEEVISTIRTAQAFGTQGVLAKLYGVYVEKSRKMDLKAAIWQGGGLSVFFFVIYAAYGLGSSALLLNGIRLTHPPLAFSFGTTLILRGQGEPRSTCNWEQAILFLVQLMPGSSSMCSWQS